MEKSGLFSAHFKQHFKSTTSHTDLRKFMKLKVVNQINPIGAMKTFKNLTSIYVWSNV